MYDFVHIWVAKRAVNKGFVKRRPLLTVALDGGIREKRERRVQSGRRTQILTPHTRSTTPATVQRATPLREPHTQKADAIQGLHMHRHDARSRQVVQMALMLVQLRDLCCLFRQLVGRPHPLGLGACSSDGLTPHRRGPWMRACIPQRRMGPGVGRAKKDDEDVVGALEGVLWHLIADGRCPTQHKTASPSQTYGCARPIQCPGLRRAYTMPRGSDGTRPTPRNNDPPTTGTFSGRAVKGKRREKCGEAKVRGVRRSHRPP